MGEINIQDLINFELKVIREYKKGETYGPVHLSGGNEEQLIEIFKQIKPQDWVFSTHRSHYHALLKSKDEEWLLNEIIVNANSSHINSRKHKIFTSAIVGGIIPIALGTALAIKLKNGKEKVWCFVGDMASEMGCFTEALKYANSEDLPITFIIEDNCIGCNTPTRKVWKKSACEILEEKQDLKKYYPKIIYYKYKRFYPHYGIGEWVTLKNENLKTQGDYNTHELK